MSPSSLVCWYSPEWLAHFVPSHAHGRPWSVHDAVLSLMLVGSMSSIEADDMTEGPNLVIARQVVDRAYQGPLGPFGLVPRDAAKRLGMSRPVLLHEALIRATEGADRRRALVHYFDPELTGDGEFSFVLENHAGPAHPINSATRQAISLDLGVMMGFRSIQSVPFATRAVSWLRTRNRVGIGRLVHEWDRVEGLVLHVPAERVPVIFGFGGANVWRTHYLQEAGIARDLALLGISVSFAWTVVGRRKTDVVVTMRNAAPYLEPRSARRGTPLWATAWTRSENYAMTGGKPGRPRKPRKAAEVLRKPPPGYGFVRVNDGSLVLMKEMVNEAGVVMRYLPLRPDDPVLAGAGLAQRVERQPDRKTVEVTSASQEDS